MRTVGVEEELLVVDRTGRPVPMGPAVLHVAARRGHGETVEEHDAAERAQRRGQDPPDAAAADPRLVPELKAQQIELGTEVCRTLEEVTGALRSWRARADAAARGAGCRVAALATSPLAVAAVTTPAERFQRIRDAFGLPVEDQLTCGCHVHVSVEDDDEGVEVLNRIRGWLPVLSALAGNSPFWQGRDTGFASFRSEAWKRWPSAGPTEPFADAEEYRRVLHQVLATGTVLDAGMLYFDARLSAQWPTVEVRVADVCLHVEDAVTHAGLVRALVETAARDARAGRPAPALRSEVLRLAAWRAGRSGITEELVHPVRGTPAPAADVVADLLDHVRAALADAGDEERVTGGAAEILRRGTGAQLQRRVHAETGDLAAVVRACVSATSRAAGAPAPSRDGD